MFVAVVAALSFLSTLAIADSGRTARDQLEPLHFNFTWAPTPWAVPPVNKQWSTDLLKEFNSTSPGALDSVCTSPFWGLTYDDGPSEFTDDLLAHLAAKNITATFMVIGSQALAHPDVLKRVYDAGHQIGIHTWSHPAMSSLTLDQQIAEIVNTAKIIKQIIGVVPTVWRPPYYAVNDDVLKIASLLGLRTIVWSLDSMDWALPWGGQTEDNLLVLFQTQVNGYRSVISLEHDGFSYSEAVAPRVLDILTTANVNIGTISQCLGLPSSYGGILDSYLSKCSKNGWLGDDNNCGVCGNACGRQGYCDQGQCFCNADGGYVGDNNNCGACGKKCPKNTNCKGSVCA